MKKQNAALTLAIAILTLSVLLSPARILASGGEEEFKWQDAARELDTYPFKQSYIDSVKKAHIGGEAPRGLRKFDAGQFASGETLVYDVGWSVFKAGVLILSAEHYRGRGLIRLGGKAMTSPAVSAIYKVRDYVITWVDAEGFYPHFFEQHVREGSKYKMDSYIVFDPKGGKLFYKRKTVEEFDAPMFTHDYMSLLYYVRSLPLNPGDTFEATMFTRPKTHPVKFRVLPKRETVSVGAGAFNCVRVELTSGGEGRVFGKKDKIEVWVTDDAHKYPVIVKSKAKVGSINAKLIQISR